MIQYPFELKQCVHSSSRYSVTAGSFNFCFVCCYERPANLEWLSIFTEWLPEGLSPYADWNSGMASDDEWLD